MAEELPNLDAVLEFDFAKCFSQQEPQRDSKGTVIPNKIYTTRYSMPHLFYGQVVYGTGRGERELNCPTANIDEEKVRSWHPGAPDGVYYGCGKVDYGEMYPMVMSVGDNPHFGNIHRSIEIHFLHDFEKHFYFSKIRCIVLGYLRPMKKYESMQELKEAIAKDKRDALKLVSKEQKQIDEWKSKQFFSAEFPLNWI